MIYPDWTRMGLVLAAAGFGAGAASAAPDLGPLPIPVWNQAYQENYEPDAIADILAGARDAYVLIDPFQPEHGDTMGRVIEQLHARGNAVSAYISVGTGEDWRDDFAQLQPHLVERQWDDWGGEYFIDQPNDEVVAIMKARIDKIAGWGFDWVEFDNMDWTYDDEYRADYGFEATIEDGVAYYRTLCDYVHEKGMKCMAKSTVEGAEAFDGATYESYEDGKNWWDEDGAKSFLAADKPVIVVHYDDTDCDATYAEYQAIYGHKLSFICEDRALEAYRHFNER
jgi:cysteinyl-tRNA synthetase, unknown class